MSGVAFVITEFTPSRKHKGTEYFFCCGACWEYLSRQARRGRPRGARHHRLITATAAACYEAAVLSHSVITVDADLVPRTTASYLRLAGDECAFIETNTAHAVPRLLAALARAEKRPEDVRYIVVTHAHLDHAGGAGALLRALPNATLLAHPRTAKHLVDPERLVSGAIGVYGAERFRTLYVELVPAPANRVRSLEDGETFDLGGATLRVHHTYGHAFHHFIVDDSALETVYTGDAFGVIYPALARFGPFALPSTSPTGFHAALARDSFDKILALGERSVRPTHFDAWTDAASIAPQLNRFVDRAEGWVEEAARDDAPLAALEADLANRWWSAIHEEQPGFTPDELRVLALDVELNAKGLAHAAVTRRDEAPTRP